MPLQATKFGVNDQAVTPLFPYHLNKENDSLLPYFHYFFLMFHDRSCLLSVLVSLQNYSSLFVIQSLPFQWNEGTDKSFVITQTVK